MRLWDVLKYPVLIVIISVLGGLLLAAVIGHFVVGVVFGCIIFIAAALIGGFIWALTAMDESAERRSCEKAVGILNHYKGRPYTTAVIAINRALEGAADELRRQMGADS